MAKGYILAIVSIPDLEAYRASGYMAMAEQAVRAHGGRFMVRGGDARLLEGDGEVERVVMLEFSSREAAERFYFSKDYAPAIKLRQSLSTARLVLLSEHEVL